VLVDLPDATGPATGGVERRYRSRVFVDYALVPAEETHEQNRRAFILDATVLSRGPHILTVNIDDSNDHVGTASVLVNVEH